MFDFDDLDANEGDALCDSGLAGEPSAETAVAKEPLALAELEATAPSHVPAFELPTARYGVGMSIESVGPTILRGAELLDSELVRRLPASSMAEVMEIGSGPTGKRIRVRALDEAVEGWVSVIAENQAPLWRAARRFSSVSPAEEATERSRQTEAKEQEAAREEERQRRRKEVEADFAAEVATGWHAVAASAAKRPTGDEVVAEAEKRAEDAKIRRRCEEQEYRPVLDAAEALHRQSQGGRPTSLFAVGDACESSTSMIMRQGEMLDSAQVKRLAASTRLEVLQIGSGPTGKRMLVRDDSGQAGWVSVIAESGVELVRVVRRAPVSVITKDGVVRIDERAGPITEVDDLPNAAFDAGDLCVTEHDFLVMTRNESLDSPTVARLPPGSRLEVLSRGIGASGRRIRAQCVEGGVDSDVSSNLSATGWISVVAEGRKASVRLLRKRHEPELWVGAGQCLGGSESVPMSEAERKAARLKAVEARMSQGAQRGVSEQAARRMEDRHRQERLRTKINELYARRREEPPMSLQSANGDALQKHLDWLAQEPPPTRPAQPSPVSRGYPGAGSAQLPAEDRDTHGAGAGVAVGGLSGSERGDVQTLEAMGFDGHSALQAFLSSGRNVELAADLLLQGGLLEPGGPVPTAVPTPSSTEVRNVNLTMPEWEAVQRLSELGFTNEAALREFVACGKDEELAGNRLLQ